MAKITWADKINVKTSTVPRENKVVADDMNEIKEAINANVDDIASKGSGYILLDTISYIDLQTASTTNNKKAYDLLAGYEITKIWRIISDPFAGSGVTSVDMTLGIDSDNNKFGFSQDCTVATPKDSEVRDMDAVNDREIKTYWESNVDLSNLTAGEAKVYAIINKVI